MTLIASGALDRAMGDLDPYTIGNLVRQMHLIGQLSLNQHGGVGGSDDGPELAAAFIDLNNNTLTYAGARMPFFVAEGDEISRRRRDHTRSLASSHK